MCTLSVHPAFTLLDIKQCAICTAKDITFEFVEKKARFFTSGLKINIRVLQTTNYSTFTKSVPVRPNVSSWYISWALAGGTTNWPGVVARAT